MRRLLYSLGGMAAIAFPTIAPAQVAPDRVDPALVTRSLPPAATEVEAARERVARPPAVPADAKVSLVADRVVARTIEVSGNTETPVAAFSTATAAYLSRQLSQDDLRMLAGAVAGVARDRGFVLATASVEPQGLAGGSLVVTLDEGRVDAVRSIGKSSTAADRILATLVTHRAMTKRELERALLLVGDLPGVRVKDTRYLRQNGFGILLVTLDDTRVSAYLQFDNRGTREIGPLRGIGLVDARGILGANDDLGLVTALTPANPSEFTFVSGRYATPVGASGGAVSLSAFYGRTRAGGDFSDLALIGHSYGVGVGYSAALARSRSRSLWVDVDLRTLTSEQSASGFRFRDDHLTILSATLRGTGTLMGGLLHVSAQASGGLPVLGATRGGDPLASRPDGDARYIAATFQADWTHPLAGPFSIALASSAQVASRPLLANAEISLGGPAFGRAYDYSERTGDEGVLGSAELRFDLARLLAPAAQRVQLYAFGDGGTVRNLRGGFGGGSLGSAGGGLRIGQGPVDVGIEVAVPIINERLDTGDRTPRVSGQLAVHF